MVLNPEHIIGRLCIAGINYKNADTAIRGNFSIDQDAYARILKQAKEKGIKSAFAISTCNRTEIYGYAHHPEDLAALLVSNTRGNKADLLQYGYMYEGKEALHHLFRVASGLDSQIVGDYEIQGQLKQAFSFALEREMIGPIMDRTINFIFQASKKIRSTTALSSGTVSVSFAAIEWLQKHIDKRPKKTLLVGSGKIGRNVCKNIRHYLPQCVLTITNRTAVVAASLSAEVNANCIPFETLATAINEYDVILVCTNAMEPVVKSMHFSDTSLRRAIIDLSMPANVEPQVGTLPNITLVNVDEISAIPQSTIARRLNEIPKAEAIIIDYEKQFLEWLQTYKHAPAIRHIKENLRLLSMQSSCEMADELETVHLPTESEEQKDHIRKTVNTLVVNLKTKKEKGCQFIQAYHHFLSPEAAAHKS